MIVATGHVGLDDESESGHRVKAQPEFSAGVPKLVKTVQFALGHSSPTITMNTYIGLWPDQIDRTRSLVDAALGGLADTAVGS